MLGRSSLLSLLRPCRCRRSAAPHRALSAPAAAASTGSSGVFRPSAVRMGWSMETVRGVVPYTSQILSARGRSFEDIAVSYCTPLPPSAVDAATGLGRRRVEDSWLELILPFPDHASLRESMADADGATLRYGKLFEIMDALAADVAYRHACSPGARFAAEARDVTIVTACVDGMRNFSRIRVDEELRLQSYVSHVGSSSMEVCIDIIRLPEGGAQEQQCGTIQFIMVARHAAVGAAGTPGRSKRVHQLLPAADAEAGAGGGGLPSAVLAERFRAGAARSATRRQRSQSSLSVSPPQPDEVSVVHKLYLASRELKAQKNMYLMGLGGRADGSGTGAGAGAGKETAPASADEGDLSDANVKQLLGKLQSGGIKWMKHSHTLSSLLMHPQSRNVHGKVFGGYVMRVAFELAQVAAMCFYGGTTTATAPKTHKAAAAVGSSTDADGGAGAGAGAGRGASAADIIHLPALAAGAHPIPTLLAVDDVRFMRPVAIGAIVEFAATVIYSRAHHAVVQVVANDVDRASNKRTTTNLFTYVFAAPVQLSDVFAVDGDGDDEVGGEGGGNVSYIRGDEAPAAAIAENREGAEVPASLTSYLDGHTSGTAAPSPRDKANDKPNPKSQSPAEYLAARAAVQTVQVMPREYDEFVRYLEGRRSLDAYLAASGGGGAGQDRGGV